jgi:hypothetical protein
LITPSTVFLEKKQFNKPPAPLKVGKLVKIVAQTSGSDVVAVVIILDRSLIDLDDEEEEDMDE